MKGGGVWGWEWAGNCYISESLNKGGGKVEADRPQELVITAVYNDEAIPVYQNLS